jgi:hypothetical protein
VDPGAAHGADHTRWRRIVDRLALRTGVADAVAGDLQRPVAAGNVEDDRVGAVEPQHIELLERDRLAQGDGEPRDDVAQARRLGDEPRNGREHAGRIS